MTDMRIDLSYPPDWVRLPVGKGKEPGQDTGLDAWAGDQARKMLPGAPPGQVDIRAGELVSLTLGCRARKDRFGFAFYPPFSGGLVAVLDVKSYAPDPDHPEITLSQLEGIYRKVLAESVGESQVSKVDLPSGPAIRVRAKRMEDSDPAARGTFVEGITHAIRPTGYEDAVVTTMTWTALHLGDELAQMADEIARSIRITTA